MYVSEIEGQSRRGRPFGRWKVRLKEYMCERGASRGRGIQKARLDRERWDSSAVAIPLRDVSRGSKVSRVIDR